MTVGRALRWLVACVVPGYRISSGLLTEGLLRGARAQRRSCVIVETRYSPGMQGAVAPPWSKFTVLVNHKAVGEFRRFGSPEPFAVDVDFGEITVAALVPPRIWSVSVDHRPNRIVVVTFRPAPAGAPRAAEASAVSIDITSGKVVAEVRGSDGPSRVDVADP